MSAFTTHPINPYYDVIIIGAGAAGLMCAAEAGKRGRRVLLIDHAKAPGEKIRISGGGRCNFTNLHTSPANYLSSNSRFCISALKRYSQHDFIRLVEKHHIAYHEKTLGQLFCDGSSRQIIDMLLAECTAGEVDLRLQISVKELEKTESGFRLKLSDERDYAASSLVISSGGLSIPKMGATGFAYDIAKKFGLEVVETRPALVPFTLDTVMLEEMKELAGIAVNEVVASIGKTTFREALLFTHRGLSGPAILQISSYWKEDQAIQLALVSRETFFAMLQSARQEHPKQDIRTIIGQHLPKRLSHYLCEHFGIEGRMADMSNKTLEAITTQLSQWQVNPSGTEGYRTAEVTLGGVDTKELSSSTMESHKVKGLYIIGEAVDVTGHLGGFNFQWAWSSGYVAGQVV